MSVFELVPIGSVKASADNVRQDVGDVSELAASIKAGGVLQPLLVDEADSVVVAGARRLAAAKKAGLKEIPVIKRSFTPQERLETMLVENLQREDLSPLEEAAAFKRLVDLGLTQRVIAERVGRSQGQVAKRLALLALPEEVQKKVDSGGITLPDAQELAKIKDDPKLVSELVANATKKGAYGPSISSKVEQEVTRRDKTKKIAAAAAALVKKGETVIDVTTDQYGYRVILPADVKEVRKEAFTAEFVEMPPAKHAKLECHAVYVDPRSFEPVECCTKPETHPSKADQIKDQRKKEADRQRKAKEAFDAMNGRRRAFVTDLVAARVDKDALLELAYLALMAGQGYRAYGMDESQTSLAAEFVKIDVSEIPLEDDVSWEDLLEEAASKSTTARLRVTLALAAAAFEVDLNRDRSWAESQQWFAWLKGRGYELSTREAELAELTGGIELDEKALQKLANDTGSAVTVVDVKPGKESPKTVKPEPVKPEDAEAFIADLKAKHDLPDADPERPASGSGRGPSGKLRNFGQMSDDKLLEVQAAVATEANDPEADAAIVAELNSRVAVTS